MYHAAWWRACGDAQLDRLKQQARSENPMTYREVLDGQRSLFGAELTLAQARGNEYRSPVQLYKVLGGGWQ
jgi:outer membrane protein TolC